jgi:hypothetical protein
MENVGFIIVRHVNSDITNKYWQESYTCIRKFYNNPIMIVDDNSNKEYLSNIELVNCTIINSEYPGVGELLGYYYFHLLKPFEKAVVIHDSVFIKQYIDFSEIKTVKFLWSFRHDWDEDILIKKLITYFDSTEELQSQYNNKASWYGCFGMMSVITLDFIDKIDKKFNFFNVVLAKVSSRIDRQCCERIFACVCTLLDKELYKNCSLYNNIHEYIFWGFSYDNYLSICDNKSICEQIYVKIPIIKVWTGR